MKRIIVSISLLTLCVVVFALSPTLHIDSQTKDILLSAAADAGTETPQTERELQGFTIQVDESSVILGWSAVPGATGYKVYSSPSPDIGSFSEDLSGAFTGASWTAPLSLERSFYYVTSLTASTPADMILVPGGTFTMGDTRGGGRAWDLPTHDVTLNSFYMAKYELTQGEYFAIMGVSPTYNYGIGDNYPMYYVSWYSAIKYCNLRSINEGLTPAYTILGSTNPSDWPTIPNADWKAVICNWAANGYRLPTEAEWEYAARGASNDPDYLYSGSENLNAVGWYMGNAYQTHPVGSKAPNALDLYDMSGNVLEWCWDWWDGSYYSSSPSNNPTGPPVSDVNMQRAARSGAFRLNASDSRVASRGFHTVYDGSNFGLGFRVARSGL